MMSFHEYQNLETVIKITLSNLELWLVIQSMKQFIYEQNYSPEFLIMVICSTLKIMIARKFKIRIQKTNTS